MEKWLRTSSGSVSFVAQGPIVGLLDLVLMELKILYRSIFENVLGIGGLGELSYLIAI